MAELAACIKGDFVFADGAVDRQGQTGRVVDGHGFIQIDQVTVILSVAVRVVIERQILRKSNGLFASQGIGISNRFFNGSQVVVSIRAVGRIDHKALDRFRQRHRTEGLRPAAVAVLVMCLIGKLFCRQSCTGLNHGRTIDQISIGIDGKFSKFSDGSGMNGFDRAVRLQCIAAEDFICGQDRIIAAGNNIDRSNIRFSIVDRVENFDRTVGIICVDRIREDTVDNLNIQAAVIIFRTDRLRIVVKRTVDDQHGSCCVRHLDECTDCAIARIVREGRVHNDGTGALCHI